MKMYLFGFFKNIRLGGTYKEKKEVKNLWFWRALKDSFNVLAVPVSLGIWCLRSCSVSPGFSVKEVTRCLLCVRHCYGLQV